jgi:hypothetical protein
VQRSYPPKPRAAIILRGEIISTQRFDLSKKGQNRNKLRRELQSTKKKNPAAFTAGSWYATVLGGSVRSLP